MSTKVLQERHDTPYSGARCAHPPRRSRALPRCWCAGSSPPTCVELQAPEDRVRQRFVAVLSKNFDDEEAIDAEAIAEAEKIVRRGAPGVRREDLDLRRVEQLVKQRIAKARGFAL